MEQPKHASTGEWVMKMRYTNTHTHMHTRTMEYHSAIKKNEFCICNNIDGRGGYLTQWNISDRVRIIHQHRYVESKEIKQMNEYNKTETVWQINRTNWSPVGREKQDGEDTGLRSTNYYYKPNKLQEYIIQHREYSQYFIVTFNGISISINW